jgi:uncharacterized protein (TIGR02646 family)
MVELQHGQEPAELSVFRAAYPAAQVPLFEDGAFQPAKLAAKAALNSLQGGLCVYCEQPVTSTGGQLEHIKPKRGAHARQDLCFVYTNYAQSCNHPRGTTCGQKKGEERLPIEPAPGCNVHWTLSTDGTIDRIRVENSPWPAEAEATLALLGLNDDSDLVDRRRDWFRSLLEVMRTDPRGLSNFLQSAPYRYILAASI